MHRLERVILSLDRANAPVLVVAHRAVLRELFAYYYEGMAGAGAFPAPLNRMWPVPSSPACLPPAAVRCPSA